MTETLIHSLAVASFFVFSVCVLIKEMVTKAKSPAEIVEKQKHKHRELLRRKRKRHIQLNSNVGFVAIASSCCIETDVSVAQLN